MSKCRQLVKAEHGPRTLDGVQCAEGSSYKLLIAGALVQREQAGFEFGNNVAGLFDESLSEFISVYHL